MPARRPVKHPFAYIRTQGREVPALVISWTRGASGTPDDWYADVVIDSINEPGHAVEMRIHQRDIRAAAPTETAAPTSPTTNTRQL